MAVLLEVDSELGITIAAAAAVAVAVVAMAAGVMDLKAEPCTTLEPWLRGFGIFHKLPKPWTRDTSNG